MRDSKRDLDVKNRLLDSVGEGEGGMIWENSIETCILLSNRQEGQGSPNGGNRLQVSDTFFLS